MDLSLLWTAVGSVAGVAAVGVAGWQVRLAIADHRLRREAAARRAEQVERAEPAAVDAARRPEASGQSVRLLPRPVFLTGREELLGELDSVFADGDGPQVAVLHGLGGCGKTSTALEYAYRHLGGFGIVWQFAAEEPTALAAGFGELAAQLGLRRMLDAGDPVAQVHSALASYPARWLLLFDNAPNRSAVESVLPPAGHGCVLVTSQDPAWPGSHRLEVQVLDTEIAAVFLQSRTGDGDLDAARELAGELGGLPLALAQAAAYMETCGYGIAEYLELFRRERAGLLARGEAAGHAEQVAGTWQLAFDRLSEDTPQAIALLRLLACCAPEQIPVRLLLRSGPDLDALPPELVPLLDSPLAVDDALSALRRYSLIGPPQDGMVSVHRLVQAVTMDLPTGQANAWREAARAIVTAVLPPDPDQSSTWPTYSALLPHAEVALSLTDDGMTRIARFLGESGDLVAARDLSGRLATAREATLGARHPDTLLARHHLARWTGEIDPYAGRDQYAALLPIRERVLGTEDPATLATRVNLARYTGRTGDYTAARDELATLLPTCKRVLGTEHPDTLLARHDLARWTGQAGDALAAHDQLAALLPDYERALGTEHPDTLWARGNLAHWTGQAGYALSARDQAASLLPICERALGPEHPLTFEVRCELARWTGEAGDAAAARDQFAALLPVMERALGREFHASLWARILLAHWTGEAGDATAARDRLAALVPVYARVIGPAAPDTLTARAYLARWTGEAGDAAAARDQFAAVLPIQEHVLGPEHREALKTRASLADWTRRAASIGSR